MYMAVLDHLLHLYMTVELHVYGCYRSPPSCIQDWRTR